METKDKLINKLKETYSKGAIRYIYSEKTTGYDNLVFVFSIKNVYSNYNIQLEEINTRYDLEHAIYIIKKELEQAIINYYFPKE